MGQEAEEYEDEENRRTEERRRRRRRDDDDEGEEVDDEPSSKRNRYEDDPREKEGRRAEDEALPASNRVYVGNIPYSMRTDDLYDTFGGEGRITDAIVKTDVATGRSRGFGIISFETEAEAARTIEKWHDHTISGRAIVVRYDRQPNTGTSSRPSYSGETRGRSSISESEIRSQLLEREKARLAKDYEIADRIRSDLGKHGVTINDFKRFWQCVDGRSGPKPSVYDDDHRRSRRHEDYDDRYDSRRSRRDSYRRDDYSYRRDRRDSEYSYQGDSSRRSASDRRRRDDDDDHYSSRRRRRSDDYEDERLRRDSPSRSYEDKRYRTAEANPDRPPSTDNNGKMSPPPVTDNEATTQEQDKKKDEHSAVDNLDAPPPTGTDTQEKKINQEEAMPNDQTNGDKDQAPPVENIDKSA